MMDGMHRLVLIFYAASFTLLQAQTPIQIQVDAAKIIAPYHPIWNYFGADEPNYTSTPAGTQLLGELSAINPSTPVYFRPHNLLTTGDGVGSLKWGSTNVYTEKPDGSAVYDWTITDRLFDNFRATHIRPMVEIGFTPKALSPHPEPYRHSFPAQGNIYTGWAYPPNDLARWRALIVAYATHLKQRYGSAVDDWLWEVWNEPDIGYFQGTPEQYLKLYDVTTAAIRQVLPNAKVGGPAVTGGGDNKHFLQLFLDHCARGTNADTSKPGAPLDFISFHPKGSPKFVPAAGSEKTGHVVMNLKQQLSLTDRGFQTIASFPEFRQTPIILSETDPEDCAACKGDQNGYRNGPLYGVSVVEMLARSAELARQRGVNLQGAVTWAFQFENQPYFAGFRELATNGPEGLIDKPVLNVFRMFGKLSGSLVSLTSSGSIPVADIIQSSVTTAPDIDGIATRNVNSMDILLWNYHDEDVSTPIANVELSIAHVPGKVIHVDRFLMDAEHGNAYSAWLKMGSPEHLAPTQLNNLRVLVLAGKAEDRNEVKSSDAPLKLSLTLQRQAVTLYHLTW
jgi:xylan 1,4-beta-xylosidase